MSQQPARRGGGAGSLQTRWRPAQGSDPPGLRGTEMVVGCEAATGERPDEPISVCGTAAAAAAAHLLAAPAAPVLRRRRMSLAKDLELERKWRLEAKKREEEAWQRAKAADERAEAAQERESQQRERAKAAEALVDELRLELRQVQQALLGGPASAETCEARCRLTVHTGLTCCGPPLPAWVLKGVSTLAAPCV